MRYSIHFANVSTNAAVVLKSLGRIGLSPLVDGFKAVFKLDDIFRISILSLLLRVRFVLLVLLKEFTNISDYIQNEQMDKMSKSNSFTQFQCTMQKYNSSASPSFGPPRLLQTHIHWHRQNSTHHQLYMFCKPTPE